MASPTAPAAAASSNEAPPATITYYRCLSDSRSGVTIDPKEVSATKGVLRADKSTKVLIRYQSQKEDYLFCRVAISELKGQTAYDVWIPGKGRFYSYSCQAPRNAPPGTKLLQLNLESTGAWPVEGADPDKLVNVTSTKIWPATLQQ